MSVTFLTRAGCAACQAARRDLVRILSDFGLAFEEIDVDVAAADGRPALRAEFGDRLPVVLLDDVEHSYWEIDEPRLRAALG